MAETLQQYFHRVYPDHCQRICEIMHAQSRWADILLSEPAIQPDTDPISRSFLWSTTTEGWEYWARLSRIEGIPLNEDFIRECSALSMI